MPERYQRNVDEITARGYESDRLVFYSTAAHKAVTKKYLRKYDWDQVEGALQSGQNVVGWDELTEEEASDQELHRILDLIK